MATFINIISSSESEEDEASPKESTRQEVTKKKNNDDCVTKNITDKKLNERDDSSSTIKSNSEVKPALVVVKKISVQESSDVFAKFSEACRKSKDADDDLEKILSKLRNKYDRMNSDDKNCESLILMLQKSTIHINNNGNLYQKISEIYDEIKRFKSTNEVSSNTEKEVSDSTAKKIVLIEKTIQKCKNKIEELDIADVDLDDDDSSYVLIDKYKRKIIQLCKKLGELSNDRMINDEIMKRKVKLTDIKGQMTNIDAIDNEILKLVNSSIKKMNNLKHIKNFNANPDFMKPPDYNDIVDIVSKNNTNLNLQLSQEKIESLALTAFKSIMKYLHKKRTRQSEEYFSFYLEEKKDEVVEDEQLIKKLDENHKIGKKNMNELFDDYVRKQSKLPKEELMREMNEIDYNESEDDDDDKDDDDDQDDVVDDKTTTDIQQISENKIEEKKSNCQKLVVLSDDDDEKTDTVIKKSQTLQVEKLNKLVGNSPKQFSIISISSLKTPQKRKFTISSEQSDSCTKKKKLSNDSSSPQVKSSINSNNSSAIQNDDCIEILSDDEKSSTNEKNTSKNHSEGKKTDVKPNQPPEIELIASSDEDIELSTAVSNDNKNEKKTKKPLIKVCAFAKEIPSSWKATSSEKSSRIPNPSQQQKQVSYNTLQKNNTKVLNPLSIKNWKENDKFQLERNKFSNTNVPTNPIKVVVNSNCQVFNCKSDFQRLK